MGRHGQSTARLYRGARIENQEHLIAASEEHMAAFFRGIALETEDVLIEMARRGEIVRIESRFQYPGGRHRRSGQRLLLQGDELGYSRFGEIEHFQKPRLGERFAFGGRLDLDDAPRSGRNEI